MKFLIDAQLPRRMGQWLRGAGSDARHTLDLPLKNQTPDAGVAATADTEDRVVITKDADFVDSHLLRGSPRKLLLISTGNLTNDELQVLITPLIPAIVRELESNDFIELSRTRLIVRG